MQKIDEKTIAKEKRMNDQSNSAKDYVAAIKYKIEISHTEVHTFYYIQEKVKRLE